MSDYEFRCPDCKKINCNHSTGEVPKPLDIVECIACGRISVVQEKFETLTVLMTGKKVAPSQLEKINRTQSKSKANKEGKKDDRN